MKKFLSLLLITLTIALTVPMYAWCAEAAPIVDDDCYEIASLINAERTNIGLTACTWGNDLESSAFVRSQEIATSFSSIRPNGKEWWTAGNESSYAETLSVCKNNNNTPYMVVRGLMHDSSRDNNILSNLYSHVAVAKYKVSDNEVYYAVEFN